MIGQEESKSEASRAALGMKQSGDILQVLLLLLLLVEILNILFSGLKSKSHPGCTEMLPDPRFHIRLSTKLPQLFCIHAAQQVQRLPRRLDRPLQLPAAASRNGHVRGRWVCWLYTRGRNDRGGLLLHLCHLMMQKFTACLVTKEELHLLQESKKKWSYVYIYFFTGCTWSAPFSLLRQCHPHIYSVPCDVRLTDMYSLTSAFRTGMHEAVIIMSLSRKFISSPYLTLVENHHMETKLYCKHWQNHYARVFTPL